MYEDVRNYVKTYQNQTKYNPYTTRRILLVLNLNEHTKKCLYVLGIKHVQSTHLPSTTNNNTRNTHNGNKTTLRTKQAIWHYQQQGNGSIMTIKASTCDENKREKYEKQQIQHQHARFRNPPAEQPWPFLYTSKTGKGKEQDELCVMYTTKNIALTFNRHSWALLNTNIVRKVSLSSMMLLLLLFCYCCYCHFVRRVYSLYVRAVASRKSRTLCCCCYSQTQKTYVHIT